MYDQPYGIRGVAFCYKMATKRVSNWTIIAIYHQNYIVEQLKICHTLVDLLE